MKKLFMVVVVMIGLFISMEALAYSKDAVGIENIPEQILAIIENSRWNDWEITGWVEPGKPGRQQGLASAFVTVKREGHNDLLAFSNDSGKWSYEWHNGSAIPQGKEKVKLNLWGDAGKAVRFITYTENEEGDRLIGCYWEGDGNGTWNLVRVNVKDTDIDTSQDQVLRFSNGNVYGVYQRNLKYFSFGAFPVSISEARDKLSNPPQIPEGTLQAKEVRFAAGEKYKVYQGPGEEYGQAGKGKAVVSTNDWIQVFGEENGWILIQYDISSDRMRMGWITAEALPKKAKIDELKYEPVVACSIGEVEVTDDPLKSQLPTALLSEGTTVNWLANMGDWAYVESITDSLIRGFVKSDMLEVPVMGNE